MARSRRPPDAKTPTKVVGVLDIGDAGVWGLELKVSVENDRRGRGELERVTTNTRTTHIDRSTERNVRWSSAS